MAQKATLTFTQKPGGGVDLQGKFDTPANLVDPEEGTVDFYVAAVINGLREDVESAEFDTVGAGTLKVSRRPSTN